MSWAASADSQGLACPVECASEGQLEGLLSELPKFKEALRAPGSSSFHEDASCGCFRQGPEVKDTAMLLGLKVKVLLLFCRGNLGDEALCSDSVEEWLPTDTSEWLRRAL